MAQRGMKFGIFLGNNVEAVRRAFTDTGRAVPDEYRYRTVGAQDVDPAAGG